MSWAVRHEADDVGLRRRVEPFDPVADPERVLRAARAVVSGVHALATRPVVPAFYTTDAVSTLAELASRRGSAGVDRLDVAAVDGKVVDEAEVSDAVRQNANASVTPVSRDTGSVEGVVDALADGAGGSAKAAVYDDGMHRAVQVRSAPIKWSCSERPGASASPCVV